VLVHVELLDLDGQRAPGLGIALVDPLGDVPAPEADVLPHVEAAPARHFEGMQLGEEALDERSPPSPVHRAGAEVHVGMAGGIGRRRRRATAAVVVAVKVVDDEPAEGVLGPVEDPAEDPIEAVVTGQGPLDDIRGEWRAPDVEVPAMLGPEVDGAGPGTVEIDLEARSVRHQMGREPRRPLGRAGVLLPEPVGFRKRHEGRQVTAQAVPGVNGHRHDVAVGLLAPPERDGIRGPHRNVCTRPRRCVSVRAERRPSADGSQPVPSR
jgi:hypothetical protein